MVATAKFNLGSMYQRLDKPMAAERMYDKIIRRYFNDKDRQISEQVDNALINKVAALAKKQPTTAIKLADSVLERNKDDRVNHRSVAGVKFMIGTARMYWSDQEQPTSARRRQLLELAKKDLLDSEVNYETYVANGGLPRRTTGDPAGSAPYNLACVCAMLGQPDEAIKWLRLDGERNGPHNHEDLVQDSDLAPLRGHDDFESYLAACKDHPELSEQQLELMLR